MTQSQSSMDHQLPTRRGASTLLILAYAAFVSLGLPDAVPGVAWPGIREEYELPQSGLGMILACGGIGYLLSSFLTGKLLQKMRIGSLLFLSTGLVSVGLAGYSLLNSWLLFLCCAFLIGTGSGAIDGSLNSFASRRFTARHVTWLHGCYGIGAAIGPAVMTHAMLTSHSWRAGYLQLLLALLALTVAFGLTRSSWNDGRFQETGFGEAEGSLYEALGNRTVLLRAFTFFAYTGLEVTIGQWNFTLNTEGRGLRMSWAGALSVSFWASLTVGRFVMGYLVARIGATRLLSLSIGGTVLGTFLFALPWPGFSATGLVLTGVSLAAIYPVLMSETPRRVGPRLTDHAVGLQVSAATLGAILLPGAAGLLAQRAGLWEIPALALLLALVLLTLHGLALRRT